MSYHPGSMFSPPIIFLHDFLFHHNRIYTSPKQTPKRMLGFRQSYLRQWQNKIWMCLKERLCNRNDSYLKIPEFTSQALNCLQTARLGMSTAYSPCPLGCAPGTSTWPPIPPHHLSPPPIASHFSVNNIPFRLPRPKTTTWYLTHIFSYIPYPHLWANSTISAFKICPESKYFSSASPLPPYTV